LLFSHTFRLSPHLGPIYGLFSIDWGLTLVPLPGVFPAPLFPAPKLTPPWGPLVFFVSPVVWCVFFFRLALTFFSTRLPLFCGRRYFSFFSLNSRFFLEIQPSLFFRFSPPKLSCLSVAGLSATFFDPLFFVQLFFACLRCSPSFGFFFLSKMGRSVL